MLTTFAEVYYFSSDEGKIYACLFKISNDDSYCTIDYTDTHSNNRKHISKELYDKLAYHFGVGHLFKRSSVYRIYMAESRTNKLSKI